MASPFIHPYIESIGLRMYFRSHKFQIVPHENPFHTNKRSKNNYAKTFLKYPSLNRIFNTQPYVLFDIYIYIDILRNHLVAK